jgi:hypothetical protein
MMANVKVDLWPGSSQTTGVSNFLFDRAVRKLRVKDVPTNAVIGYNEAAQAVLDFLLNEIGGAPGTQIVHPNNPTLPLARVFLERWGAHEFKGVAEYAKRSISTLPHPPGVPFVNMTGAYWGTNWARSGEEYPSLTSPLPGQIVGYPSGEIIGVNSAADTFNPNLSPTPKPRELSIAVIKAEISTVLNFNPYGQVAVALNKVNAFTLGYGGVSIPAGKIRFDACDVRGEYIQATNTTKYKVVYKFTLSPHGFYEQSVYFGPEWGNPFPSSPTGGLDQWRTRGTPVYQFITFPPFPIG